MTGSLKILAFFTLGLLLGYKHWVPQYVIDNDLSVYALYVLMFLVGVLVGLDKKSLDLVKNASWQLVLLPVSTALGTYAGVLAVYLLLKDLKVWDVLAVGSGFGYYSLSSIIITELKSKSLGLIALLSNIFRELLTLLFTPIFAKYFGPFGPILSGGATSMDTTLPIITEYSGKEYTLLSVFNGLMLTLVVPFLVTFFCEL